MRKKVRAQQVVKLCISTNSLGSHTELAALLWAAEELCKPCDDIASALFGCNRVITIIQAGRNDSVEQAKDAFDLPFHSIKSFFKAWALCPTFRDTLSANSGSWCPACWHSWTQWRLPAISWFQKAVLQSQQHQPSHTYWLWKIGCGTEAFTDSGRGVWTWWLPDKADLNETAFSFVLITGIININSDPHLWCSPKLIYCGDQNNAVWFQHDSTMPSSGLSQPSAANTATTRQQILTSFCLCVMLWIKFAPIQNTQLRTFIITICLPFSCSVPDGWWRMGSDVHDFWLQEESSDII